MEQAILIFILSLAGAFVLRVCGFAIGTWIGSKVFHRMSTDVVKKVAYAYIAISGVMSLILS